MILIKNWRSIGAIALSLLLAAIMIPSFIEALGSMEDGNQRYLDEQMELR